MRPPEIDENRSVWNDGSAALRAVAPLAGTVDGGRRDRRRRLHRRLDGLAPERALPRPAHRPPRGAPARQRRERPERRSGIELDRTACILATTARSRAPHLRA